MHDHDSLTRIIIILLGMPFGAICAFTLKLIFPKGGFHKITGIVITGLLLFCFLSIPVSFFCLHNQPNLQDDYGYLVEAALSIAAMLSLYEIYTSPYVTEGGKIKWTLAIVIIGSIAMPLYLFTTRRKIFSNE